MFGGDISNKSAITVMLNIDIFIKAEVKDKKSIIPLLSKKETTLELIEGNALYLNHLWKKCDMTVYITGVLGGRDLDRCEELLGLVSHSKAVLYETEEEMLKAIRVVSPEYYFESDYNRKIRVASVLPYTKCGMFQEMRSIF